MKPSMKKYIVAAFVAASMTTVYAQSAVRDTGNIADAYIGASRERRLKKAVSNIINNMVAIPGKNFKMGKYEVTQEQWEAVMGENPSDFKAPNNPVENVSWEDCKKFLEKLNSMPEVKKSGLTFRLPTEKAWEYACRAGSTGDYCKLADGTEITKGTQGEVAWYEDNSGRKTHPVGQKKPNAFGLYDMHGNVWEWTQSKYTPYPYVADDGRNAPDGDERRVVRGGSWYSRPKLATASFRRAYHPYAPVYDVGFRIVVE